MAKSFKIQNNPTFKSTVKVPRIGAEPMEVSFTFKSFDRRALAKIFDRWSEDRQALMKEATERRDEGNDFTLEEWADREITMQVSQLKDVVEGWGFSDEFSDENIEALVESSVNVTDVILENYNEAYNRARLGN